MVIITLSRTQVSVVERAWKKYGINEQLDQLEEELVELLLALKRRKRLSKKLKKAIDSGTADEVNDIIKKMQKVEDDIFLESADVEICNKYLQYVRLDAKACIDAALEYKINRLSERMENE